MCPACLASAAIASAALMAAGVISTGGLAALAAKLLRPKNSPERLTSEGPKRKEKRSMATATSKQEGPKIVPQAEWLAARKELLKKEKEFSRLRDELSRQRRELPWEKVEKAYVFDGPQGKETLADLFGGRSQLIVYHFMFGPGWAEGCPSCSFISDHIDGSVVHLAARDVRLAVVSRAPLAEIEAFQKRMGWRVHLGASYGGGFKYDFPVALMEGGAAKRPVDFNHLMEQIPRWDSPRPS